MKKFILLITILILLTGCGGIYNLNNFMLPDDSEFLAVVESLDTPEKITNYMEDNFTYKLFRLANFSPYNIWKNKKGDCNDYMAFSTWIANYHGYKTYHIIITFIDEKDRHSIAVYKESKYSFSDCEMYFLPEYDTFLEIVEYDCFLRRKNWSKYTVYDYNMDIVEVEYK